jgi:hypothetical protein
MATMKPMLCILALVVLSSCRTDGAALSNVYPGYLGAQGGYAQPYPAYVPYRAPVQTHCHSYNDEIVCRSY